MKLKKIAALVAIAAGSAPAFATNGMNMEGYGPVATGMGGASFAYYNGNAGMINNPATLGLMPNGTSRLDIAVGGLHPSVTSKMTGMPDAESGGTSYLMPAVGYARKDGKLTWGAGMMAQGGMGTEYGSSSFLSGVPGIPTMMNAMAPPTGAANRSELGIGRVMVPVSYEVSPGFSVGGSADFLWGGLDLQMVMSGAMFRDFASGTSPAGVATGSMVTNLPAVMGAFQISDINWAQFDFSKGDNGMTQRLTTTGWAGNVGFVWQASPSVSVGGIYHAKTSLKDMEGSGTLNMNATTPGGAMTVPITGTLKVVDFQWPETYGIGVALQASDNLLLAADYKRIGWAKVMQHFHMSFVADATQANPAAQGMVSMQANAMEAMLNQNWDDQNVVMLGFAYKTSEALTVRGGLNLANNPVPNSFMNPLFPATVKNHVTVGFGYAFDKKASVDFSFTYAPEVSAANSGMGVTTTHSQTNWQLMYSNRF
jgi:long-chain fatty acid transport protein